MDHILSVALAKKESLIKDIGDTIDMPDTILGLFSFAGELFYIGLFIFRGGLILVSIIEGPSKNISLVIFFFKFSRENICRRFDFYKGGLGAGLESITNKIEEFLLSKTIEDFGDLSYRDKLYD
jgi:hypothetical protein